MILEHRYSYKIDGVYIISEVERTMYDSIKLPFNIFKDPIKVAAGYIRWSDDAQSDGHSFHIQERELVYRAKKEGFEAVVMFVDQAASAYHTPAQKRKK